MSQPSIAGRTGASHDGIVISVMSPVGGTGKTTVATLLGAQIPKLTTEFAEQNALRRPFSVCLVDLDVLDGQLSFIMGQTSPTAVDLALSKEPLNEELVRKHLVFNEELGVHALLASLRGDRDRDADPAFYRETIQLLKTMFDVVIIDTSVDIHDIMNRMVPIPEADHILLVLNDTASSVGGGQRWVSEATKEVSEGGLGVDSDTISVVFNSMKHPIKWNLKEMTVILGAKPRVFIPFGGKDFVAAGNSSMLATMLDRPEFNTPYTHMTLVVTSTMSAKMRNA